MFDITDLVITVGENRNVPEMIIQFNGQTYNVLSWLHDQDTLSLVHSIRDLCGAFCYVYTIFSLLVHIPKILDGDFYGVNVFSADFGDNNYRQSEW